MSDNHRLIKDVSHALKHYIDVRRKEEAFDLSGVYTPPYDIHKYRFNTNFGYVGTNDMQVKHNFPKNNFKKIFSEEANRREKFFRNELIYHLKKGTESHHRKKASRTLSSKDNRSKNKETKLLPARSRSKSATLKPVTSYIPLGLLSIRSKPTPFLTKGERKRVIQTTSMILSATDEVFHKEKKTTKKTPRIDTDKTRENDQYLQEYMRINAENDKEEEYEEKSTKDSPVSEEIAEPLPIVKKKKGKKPEKDTDSIDFDLLESYEVKAGAKIKYVVTIQTGSRPGSSTQAIIKIKLFGDRFDNYIKTTKWITLEKSKTHKLPFQRGNEDVFEIEFFDIGKLRAITIGHMEKEIKYSWFLERVNIHEPIEDINYEFLFHKWFSQCTEDQKHIRTAFCARAFFVPKAEKNQVGVIKSSSLSRSSNESAAKEEPKTLNNDYYNGIFQKQKILTPSVEVNRSTISTTTRSSSTSATTPSTKINYVEKEYISGSSSPRVIVNTVTVDTQAHLIESKTSTYSSSSSSKINVKRKQSASSVSSSLSSSSSSAIEVKKNQIEVHSRTSSASKNRRKRYSSNSLSDSSSATITPRNEKENLQLSYLVKNSPAKENRRNSVSSSSTQSSRNGSGRGGAKNNVRINSSSSSSSLTSSSAGNKKSEKKTINVLRTENVVRRPASSSDNSSTAKNNKKEEKLKLNSDSDSARSEREKFIKFDLSQIPAKPNPERYHINNGSLEGKETEAAVVATVVTKPQRDSSSDSSSSSTVSTSSTSSSSTSSTSSISVKKTVTQFGNNSESISPDEEDKLNEMSIKAFNLLSLNDLSGLKDLIDKSSKIVLSRNSVEETLLSAACKKNFNGIVKFLVQTDDILLSIDTPEGFYPIHFCASNNNLEGLKILYEHGAIVDIQTNEGSTALHLAAMDGFLEICKYLISKDAKLDIKDENSRTPIDLASSFKHSDVVEFLTKSKSRNSPENKKAYITQQSLISNATDKELLAVESNQIYDLQSPVVRPERPFPARASNKSSDSESDDDNKQLKNEAIRSNQPSSVNYDYTTIPNTNQTSFGNLIAKNIQKRDSESSESDYKKGKIFQRKTSDSSTESLMKNEVKQPNMGRMNNSLSDKTSTASSDTITGSKPSRKKTAKEDILSD